MPQSIYDSHPFVDPSVFSTPLVFPWEGEKGNTPAASLSFRPCNYVALRGLFQCFAAGRLKTRTVSGSEVVKLFERIVVISIVTVADPHNTNIIS
jgi:hypothetical protein